MKQKIEETVIENVVMDQETLQAIVEDNMSIVPKNKMKEFMSLSLEKQAQKIKLYQDLAKMKEDARIKNSLPNKVKELFERRKATVEDAKAIIQFCTEYVDNFKLHQIEEIDKKIAELEAMKEAL